LKKNKVIIIGSGLGGLLSGYILGKEGYEVTVLEKANQPGGCLQSFKKYGKIFDTGIHYLGSLDEGQILNRYFKYFGLMKDIEYKRMDSCGFDVIKFDNDPVYYPYAMGMDNFINNLCDYFPTQKDGLNALCNKINHICNNFPLYNLDKVEEDISEVNFYAENAYNYINSVISDPNLQRIIAGNTPIYGGVASQTPLYIFALITKSFVDSSWKIIGGSNKIAQSLVNSIESFGGRVICNKEAIHFNVGSSGKISGVKISDGDYFESDYFVSDIHPRNLLEMIDGSVIHKAYRHRISNLENTISNFSLYVTFKKDSFPYLNYNLFNYKNIDPWQTPFYKDSDWPEHFLFLTPASTMNDKFAESAAVVTYAKYDEFLRWEGTKIGDRGESYEEFKAMKTKKMFEFADKRIPNFAKSVDKYFASTPLTYHNYTGTYRGSMYGILKDSNNPLKTLISPRTKIPNLFLTGQNVILHGALGVSIGAVYTCTELLGREYLINTIRKS